MSRSLRPYLPGAAFHITARIHDGERLLVGLQAPVAGLIRGAARCAGARLVAYVVMSNHIHLLVIQGRAPLGELMQPLLRRTALIVQRAHDRKGHVFERRYAARPCLDAEYLRNAIAYIHLNPVRAGLCRDAAEYVWSSHSMYRGSNPCVDNAVDAHDLRTTAASMLRLFALSADCAVSDCRATYGEFLARRLERDRFEAEQVSAAAVRQAPPPEMPDCIGGDLHWARGMAPFTELAEVAALVRPTPRGSLEALAGAALRELQVDMPLDLLRTGLHSRALSEIRRPVMASCLAGGYTTGQVARFMRVSTSTVSRVARVLREPVSA